MPTNNLKFLNLENYDFSVFYIVEVLKIYRCRRRKEFIMKENTYGIPEGSLKSLCDEFRKYNKIDPKLFETYSVKRGLRNADREGQPSVHFYFTFAFKIM